MQCQCEQGPKASGRRPEAVAIVRGAVAHHTLVVQFGWIAGIFVNIDATAMVLCSVVGYVATRQGDVAIVDIDATTLRAQAQNVSTPMRLKGEKRVRQS